MSHLILALLLIIVLVHNFIFFWVKVKKKKLVGEKVKENWLVLCNGYI